MVSRIDDTVLTRYYLHSLTELECVILAKKTIKILKGNGVKSSELKWLNYENVMYVLLRKADDEGCVFATLKEISEDIHYSSPYSISRFLQILEDNSLIYRRNGLILFRI